MPHQYNHTDTNREQTVKTAAGMKRKQTKQKPKNPIKKPKPIYQRKKTISY